MSKMMILRRYLFFAVIIIHVVAVLSIIQPESPLHKYYSGGAHAAGPGCDFFAVYKSGRNLAMGHSPYNNERDGVTPYWYVFRYLPPAAIIGYLFQLAPPFEAFWFWVLILEASLVLFLVILKRRTSSSVWYPAAIILLLSMPYLEEIMAGQFTFFSVDMLYVAVMTVGGLAAWLVMALLKPFPFVTIPVLIRHRQYWLMIISGVIIVLTLSIIFFQSHPGSWQWFVKMNGNADYGYIAGNVSPVYLAALIAQDLQWEWALTNWTPLVQIFRYALFGITACYVFFRRVNVIPGVAIMLLIHFMTFHQVWECQMSAVIIIGLSLLMARIPYPGIQMMILLGTALLALPTIFVFYDVPNTFDPSQYWPRWVSYAIVLSKVIPMLFLFVTAVYISLHPESSPARRLATSSIRKE